MPIIFAPGQPVVTPPAPPVEVTQPGAAQVGGTVTYAPVPDVAPLAWTWTSWTGDSWTLTDPASSVLKLRGATGVGLTAPEHWWADSPTLDGESWDGSRMPNGEVFLPVAVRGGSSVEFLAEHGRFMRSLNPSKRGTLRVTRPTGEGEWREVSCRYVSGADAPVDLDPVASRLARYGITWARDPYWRGAPVSVTFRYEPPRSLFPGPPFDINSSRVLGSAQVTNPGDAPTRPVWRVRGPFTGFTVGVGSSVVSMTLTKPAGAWVEVDMDPRRLTVLDESGADLYGSLTARTFAAIPPGTVDLTTEIAGAGESTSAVLSFTPLYFGAL